MNSDGVSLPTTIAQLGSVAKTQSRAQQQAQPAAPFKEQLDRQEDLKVQRVKQAEAADHRRIEADEETPDKRKRRRQRRERKLLAQGRGDEDDEAGGDAAAEDQETVGGLIDLRA
ncbi:MAG: hypothetical protein R6X35_16700 [Candidatus Krumholzibacteriia bacterium]